MTHNPKDPRTWKHSDDEPDEGPEPEPLAITAEDIVEVLPHEDPPVRPSESSAPVPPG